MIFFSISNLLLDTIFRIWRIVSVTAIATIWWTSEQLTFSIQRAPIVLVSVVSLEISEISLSFIILILLLLIFLDDLGNVTGIVYIIDLLLIILSQCLADLLSTDLGATRLGTETCQSLSRDYFTQNCYIFLDQSYQFKSPLLLSQFLTNEFRFAFGVFLLLRQFWFCQWGKYWVIRKGLCLRKRFKDPLSELCSKGF